ncbi:MAG: PTS sugar transporter subunit IIA [Candidatus Methylacidiphilales bacterium]
MGTLISDTLTRRWVTVPLKSEDHEGVIREVLGPMTDHLHVKNWDQLFRETWTRELKESTCIGNGIAFPHARCEAVDQLVIAAGVHAAGVNFSGVPGKIHLIFSIGTPLKMGKEYLAVVGSLARFLKDESVRQKLMQSKTADQFCSVLYAAEKQS